MARRRIGRALASFGGSLQRVAETELQNRLIKERQAAESALIGGRQAEEHKRDQTAKLVEGLRSGSILPQQVSDEERTAIKPTRQASGLEGPDLMSMTPPDQILAKPIFENLSKITKAGQVPGSQEIFNQRLSQGPIKDLSSLTGLLNTGTQQKERLASSEAFDRDSAIAQAQGEAFSTKVGENEAANVNQPDVLRRSLETGQQNVKLAGQEQYARSTAEIRAKINNAAAILKLEGDSARQKAAIEQDANRAKARFEAVSKSEATAATALPQLGNLYALWLGAKDDIAKMAKIAGPLGPASVDARINLSYAGIPENIRLYYSELEKSLPFFARLTGEVGNLAEQEQVRQRFGLPTAYDAVQGTGDEKLETAIALAMKAGKLSELNMDPATMALDAGTRLNLLESVLAEGKAQLKTRRQGIDEARERQELLKKLGGR